MFLDTKQPDDLNGLVENFGQHRLQSLSQTRGGEHTAFATKAGGKVANHSEVNLNNPSQPKHAYVETLTGFLTVSI